MYKSLYKNIPPSRGKVRPAHNQDSWIDSNTYTI